MAQIMQAGEECSNVRHLSSAVDDVNLMKGDHMHHLLAFLQLTLRTLHKLGGWA